MREQVDDDQKTVNLGDISDGVKGKFLALCIYTLHLFLPSRALFLLFTFLSTVNTLHLLFVQFRKYYFYNPDKDQIRRMNLTHEDDGGWLRGLSTAVENDGLIAGVSKWMIGPSMIRGNQVVMGRSDGSVFSATTSEAEDEKEISIWSMRLWTPHPFSITFFKYYNPITSLLYLNSLLALDPSPGIADLSMGNSMYDPALYTWYYGRHSAVPFNPLDIMTWPVVIPVETFTMGLVTSMFVAIAMSKFEQHVKDVVYLQDQVLREYRQKTVAAGLYTPLPVKSKESEVEQAQSNTRETRSRARRSQAASQSQSLPKAVGVSTSEVAFQFGVNPVPVEEAGNAYPTPASSLNAVGSKDDRPKASAVPPTRQSRSNVGQQDPNGRPYARAHSRIPSGGQPR